MYNLEGVKFQATVHNLLLGDLLNYCGANGASCLGLFIVYFWGQVSSTF